MNAAWDGPLPGQRGLEMKRPQISLRVLMASDGVHLPSAAPDTACFFFLTEVKPRLTSMPCGAVVRVSPSAWRGLIRIFPQSHNRCNGCSLKGSVLFILGSWKGRSIKSILCVGKKMSACQSFFFFSPRHEVDQEGLCFQKIASLLRRNGKTPPALLSGTWLGHSGSCSLFLGWGVTEWAVLSKCTPLTMWRSGTQLGQGERQKEREASVGLTTIKIRLETQCWRQEESLVPSLVHSCLAPLVYCACTAQSL